MVNKGIVLTVFLFITAPSAIACDGSFIGKMISYIFDGLFYEIDDVDSGELSGLVIGTDRNQVASFLKSRGVLGVTIVNDNDFYATAECIDEVERIGNEGNIHINRNKIWKDTTIYLNNGLVSKIESGKETPLTTIKQGMSRNELIVELKNVLATESKVAVYPAPSCERKCGFTLRDVLDKGNKEVNSAKAWAFVFPDGKGRYTVYFTDDRLTRIRYQRQRFRGDGVF